MSSLTVYVFLVVGIFLLHLPSVTSFYKYNNKDDINVSNAGRSTALPKLDFRTARNTDSCTSE